MYYSPSAPSPVTPVNSFSTRYYSDKDLYVGDFTFEAQSRISVPTATRDVAYITLDTDLKRLVFTYGGTTKKIA